MRVLQRGEVIQLERKGYFIVDRPYVRSGKPMVLFAIPDGRVKSLSAKPPATAQQAATAVASAAAVAKAAGKPAANGLAKVAGQQRQASLSTADTPVSTKVRPPYVGKSTHCMTLLPRQCLQRSGLSRWSIKTRVSQTCYRGVSERCSAVTG